jgi:high-affinity iron transporter
MGDSVTVLNIGVLVFREGLECILVLAAITANLTGPRRVWRRPVIAGAALGCAATLVTWRIAVRVLNDLSQNISALALQAATGLLAVIVLLVVMNWFFHKTYWTGWISLHNRRKQALFTRKGEGGRVRVLLGLALLGFSSFYREGFEVVLFLQSYRLRVDWRAFRWGVLSGLLGTSLIGILTFALHRKLPYKRMLVLTGALLGVVLFVMVGEQVQEMQLAHWLPTSTIPWLAAHLPQWPALWLSVFPTIESLTGQALAISLVLGSYLFARNPRSVAT